MDETMAHEPNPAPNRHADEARGRFAYASGIRPLEGYTIKRAIGRGGFGEVYYAVTDAGKEVALKLITRNLEVERRGVQQCMNLKSPHLIGIHDVRTNDEGDTFVIMEYVAGPNLATILERSPGGLPHHEVRHWLKGLVEGVAYLHDHGVVHRDLKPANLFLEEGVVKIGDYGLSKAITSSKEPGHSQSVGTCHYMAPEIGTGKYHKPIDVYAIGIIVYEMLTGRVPFDGESVQEVLMKHLTSRPDLSPLPEPFKSIVARALAKDPNQRPARVTELLLPGDVPREPSVRFITDNKTATAGSPPAPSGGEEEILRIGPEEPVLYIGPDTMPPRDRVRKCGRMVRRFWNACPVNRNAPPRQPAPVPRPVPAPVVRRATIRREPPAPTRPQAPPEPPPSPPILPSGRVRLAELAGSMLLATPLAAMATLLCVPLFGMLDAPHPQRPEQLALLFSTILLGTWGVLVPAKFWEGRAVSGTGRRLTQMVVGLAVGLVATTLVGWAHLDFPARSFNNDATRQFVQVSQGSLDSRFVPFAIVAGYFGLTFAAVGFGKLTDRDRKARFRFFPVGLTALLAGVLATFVPSPEPWSAIVVVCVAILVQLASPWSREAATYAQYHRALGRRAA